MIETNQILNSNPLVNIEIFRCPICKEKLFVNEIGQLYCSNTQCTKNNESFLLLNNKPVLIDFDKSIIGESNFTANVGKSLVPRREKWFGKALRYIFQGESSITRSNVSYLIKTMNTLTNPRILVVGGGEIGSGFEEFYQLFRDNIMSFDIYDSENIEFIADGHSIPLQSEVFDLVIIQAVLEHVLDPQLVASECTRVLKKGGIIYAETPFMQQIHEGPFDFTRFTESGHRYLFKEHILISSGHTSGVGVALIWSLSAFFSGLFQTRKVGKLIRVLFFWLRFFDKLVPNKYNVDGACGVYFIGKKDDQPIKSVEIIKHYKGSQRI